MRRVVYKGLVSVLALAMVIFLSVVPAEAAYYDFNWDFSSPKEEERDDLIKKGYKEVTLEEAEKIGLDYYNKRNRYSEEVKIFCEGALSGELEELYTSHVNCYDSYQEAAMLPYIDYKKEHYYSSYSFGVKFSNFRQDNMTDNQYDMAMKKAASLAEQFNHGTTKEKIRNVYDWICDNMEYDDSLTRGSIYDAFVLGDTVCTGYATAFQVIMEDMGIESYLCTGVVEGENHAWNAVNVDGRYYFVDATFGDTSGNLDKWVFFGTDRRVNETNLVIHTESEYSDAEEMLYLIIGLVVIIGVPLILVIIIIVVCLKVDSKRRKKNIANNTYANQGYGQNPYANPYANPATGAYYGQGMSPYTNPVVNPGINPGANPYMNSGMNQGMNYGGSPYMNPGTNPYANPYTNPNPNPYISPNQGQYVNAGQYGSGQAQQYGNTQYGNTQYGNTQYNGAQYSQTDTTDTTDSLQQ